MSEEPSRRYLKEVSYNNKDRAKQLGAKYDGIVRKWYLPDGLDLDAFGKLFRANADTQPKTAFGMARYRANQSELGKYLRYCDEALQQANLDQLVDPRATKNITHEEFVDGRTLEGPTPEFIERTPLIADCLLKLPSADATELQPADYLDTGNDDFLNDDKADTVAETPLEDAALHRAVFIVFGRSWAKKIEKTDGWNVLFAVPVAMSESGTFAPVQGQLPLFNLEFFEPQTKKKREPILGEASVLEDVLNSTNDFAGSTWSSYVEWLDEIFARVTQKAIDQGGRIREFKDARSRRFHVAVVPYARNDAMVLALRKLYAGAALEPVPRIPLLTSLYHGQEQSHPPMSDEQSKRSAILNTGHMGSDFGLDPSQRSALRHLLQTPIGSTLAVSGPPGTGKTALMRSVIATTIVNAAIATDPRPAVIVASSALNQAVTNVIKAFASVGKPFGEATLDARWIPDVPSYGWYFPSRSKAESVEASSFQQLLRPDKSNVWLYSGTATDFQSNRKANLNPKGLRDEFLHRFNQVFPKQRAGDIAEATARLRSALIELVDSQQQTFSLQKALDVIESLAALTAIAPLAERYRANYRVKRQQVSLNRLSAYEGLLKEQISLAQDNVWDVSMKARERPSLRELLRVLVTTSSWRTLLETIKMLFRRNNIEPEEDSQHKEQFARLQRRLDRLYQRRSRVERMELRPDLVSGIHTIQAGIAYFKTLLNEFLPSKSAYQSIAGFESALTGHDCDSENEDFKRGWNIGATILDGKTRSESLADLLESWVDRTIRFRCFHLAARYWEGRWLMECDKSIDGNDEESVVSAVRRHCMLAPVIVATAYTLPNLLKVPGVDDAPDSFAFSAADLLIIDEAGQVQPPTAVALFALAQRAIVVGDVEQLAPIVKIPEAQDNSLLRLHGFAPEIADLRAAGLTAVGGSIMRAAQSSSYFGGEVLGVTLLRHYRCRPSIIEFCNELVYKRTQRLIPMTRQEREPLFHPMSYVELQYDSKAPSGGSRYNDGEAREIIEWLKFERDAIEAHYNRRDGEIVPRHDPAYRDLRQLVALITPYAAQKEHLTQLVRDAFTFGAADEDSDDAERNARMVIGTVHALQGAERPIVVFSPVSSANDGKMAFMDAGTEMLNVAVSRAQDTFVLFGNKNLFFSKQSLAQSNRLPSATLGRYLRKFGKHLYPRTLVVIESAHKRKLLEAALGKACVVRATSGHFREIGTIDFDTMTASWKMHSSKPDDIVEMSSLLDDMDEVVLATDDDQEGEAISWHVLDELKKRRPMDGIRVSRMVFHEVTESAIKNGFARRVHGWHGSRRATAALTRALIDHVLGDVLTRNLTQAMNKRDHAGFHPMGRVRAALLELVERDQRDTNPSFSIGVDIRAQDATLEGFLANDLSPFEERRFESEEAAASHFRTLRLNEVSRTSQKTTRFTIGLAEPSSTVQVLIRAYEELGMMPDKTQDALQELYEGR